MAALQRLTAPTSEVIRSGLHEVIAVSELVPGDLIVLGDGEVVPADARVTESRGLIVNESLLTGEPEGVAKESESIDDSQAGVVYAGTTVVRGSGSALVVATGSYTELGRISKALGESRRAPTPLEMRLEELGKNLIAAFLVLCALVVVIGLIQGREAQLVIEIAVSLAIGAVPEGLPAVATTTLALAVRRLAIKNVIVRRLDAVESLGSTTIVITDKTGTLTENRMVVRSILLPKGNEISVDLQRSDGQELGLRLLSAGAHEPEPALRNEVEELLVTASLCSDAVVEYDQVEGWHAHGDPTEVAIAMATAGLGYPTAVLTSRYPRTETDPFTSATRMMKTTHHSPIQAGFTAIKGAPEIVASLTRLERGELLDRVAVLSNDGLRVLAVAKGSVAGPVHLLGFLVLEDPLRGDAKAAVAACFSAGIRVLLVTGDHLETARRIGEQTGILRDSSAAVDAASLDGGGLSNLAVVARASHSQKRNIVERLRLAGEVTAMMGDGVNDAPALSAAHVGVAVGPHASDVAMEASQIVVSDGRLDSLVEGVLEGRRIALNLRHSIMYLLTASFGTILLIAVAMLSSDQVPLAPLQILWLNLVVHIFPALALSTGKELPVASTPTKDVLPSSSWFEVAIRAATVAMSGVLALLISDSWGEAPGHTQAMVFGTVAAALLGQAFVIDLRSGISVLRRATRVDLWIAVLFSMSLALLAMYGPGLQSALELETISVSDWLVVGGCTLLGLVIAQAATNFVVPGLLQGNGRKASQVA